MSKTTYGRLIGVSLGPGDPELITRRGWRLLQGSGRWAYPVKRGGADSYALDIVRRSGLEIPGDVLELIFPMTRNPRLLTTAWSRAAATTLEALGAGRDLLFLVEGDASTYSTFRHLARAVRELDPAIPVETLPGVSSFAAAAAVADLPLAEEDETLAVIPAAYGIEVIDRMLDEFDTLVLMKIKPMLEPVLDLLQARRLLPYSCFVEKVGAPGERVIHHLEQLRDGQAHYLSLLIVHNPWRTPRSLHRGCRIPKRETA